MKIVTLTLNPALDKSTYIELMQPEKKLRCEYPVWHPGGGGINVSRAIKILGGESLAIYAAGGTTGDRIEELLNEEGVDQQRIGVKSPARENLMVMEKATGNQFRFGMPGHEIYENELEQCLELIRGLDSDVEYLVASGSLPPGAPDNFYGKVAKIATEKDIKCVVDTSGNALMEAAKMGVCMMKPNLRELSYLGGEESISGMQQEDIARKILNEGKASILVVSLGARGAMIATKSRVEYIVPPTVKSASKVGAGDSMVAGLVLSMSRGHDLRDSVKWGVAAGTAATMTPGTELCRREDVEKIYHWLDNKEG